MWWRSITTDCNPYKPGRTYNQPLQPMPNSLLVAHRSSAKCLLVTDSIDSSDSYSHGTEKAKGIALNSQSHCQFQVSSYPTQGIPELQTMQWPWKLCSAPVPCSGKEGRAAWRRRCRPWDPGKTCWGSSPVVSLDGLAVRVSERFNAKMTLFEWLGTNHGKSIYQQPCSTISNQCKYLSIIINQY